MITAEVIIPMIEKSPLVFLYHYSVFVIEENISLFFLLNQPLLLFFPLVDI
tara:strand:+ start:209 stop:361 length:153 start_codon:yes stop_codon:yes gene_type:complete